MSGRIVVLFTAGLLAVASVPALATEYSASVTGSKAYTNGDFYGLGVKDSACDGFQAKGITKSSSTSGTKSFVNDSGCGYSVGYSAGYRIKYIKACVVKPLETDPCSTYTAVP